VLGHVRENVDAKAHRTPGSGSGLDKNDLRLPSLNWEFEIKHTQSFSLKKDWEQLERQTMPGTQGALIMNNPYKKPEFTQLLAVLDFEDFIDILAGQRDTNTVEKLPDDMKYTLLRLKEYVQKTLKYID
jgi:hypothetical protein